jgi:hypothetical protein
MFEKPVSTIDDGKGFADVWKRGFFGWEYKGKHKDLAAAYRQLLRYREDLENPHIADCLRPGSLPVHANFTATRVQVYAFTFDDLLSCLGATAGFKRTPTDLYNARPQWLADAHRKLDEAVFAA